ncbi:MAG: hypothetical protein IKP38_07880 [Clostridia bacterium]|nr:hypothetical protein [Clostridia bacterium]
MNNDLLVNILIGLGAGLISGLASSLITYFITKRREKKEFLFNYWHNYIFSALDKCGVYFPRFEELTSIRVIGDKDSKWYKAITEIQDQLHPENFVDKEFSNKEEVIARNAIIALEELNMWKNKRAAKRRK